MREISRNVPLAPYTTLKIGGAAERFAVAGSEDELRALSEYARANSLPVTVIGGGSNVLVADNGVAGLVIKNEIAGIAYDEKDGEARVTAGAGVAWDDLVADTVARGWWGLENLSAIPGTVGATPVQNVGAYGVEVSELIEKVRVYDATDGDFKEMPPQDCGFGYRDSVFKTEEGRRYVITAVTYRLFKTPHPRLHYRDLAERFGVGAAGLRPAAPTPAAVRTAVIDIRRDKFPDVGHVGTAGSFFKNPVVSAAAAQALRRAHPDLPTFPQSDGQVKVSLGFILDRVCGLRGYREGDVGTYERQSLVLVNYGGASAADVASFAKKISDIVLERTGITIENEVNFLK